MGEFAAGDIVLVTFPFSDLKGHKLRPALVLAQAEFGNFILSQITSKPYSSRIAILLKKNDFQSGSLPVKSYVRPDKLFTADKAIVKNSIGKLTAESRGRILKKARDLFAQ